MAARFSRVDGVGFLTDEHERFRQMHAEYSALGDDTDAKRALFHDLRAALTAHEVIEELVVYPAVREEIPGGQQIAEKRAAEKDGLKRALAALESGDPATPGFDEQLEALVRDVLEHARAEETQVFTLLREHLSQERLENLGAALAFAKRLASTRPLLRASGMPVANVLAGPPVTLLDRTRDALDRLDAAH